LRQLLIACFDSKLDDACESDGRLEGKTIRCMNSDVNLYDSKQPIKSIGTDLWLENIYGDFTVNRLWYDPSNDMIIDPTGWGVADTLNKHLRIPVPQAQWDMWARGQFTRPSIVFCVAVHAVWRCVTQAIRPNCCVTGKCSLKDIRQSQPHEYVSLPFYRFGSHSRVVSVLVVDHPENRAVCDERNADAEHHQLLPIASR
jgi:hypothetical protein